MKKLIALSFLCIFIIAFSFVSSVSASTYGSGTYGSDVYGGSEDNSGGDSGSDSGNDGSSSSNDGGSSSGPTECTNAKPGSSPYIFQVDRRGSQAVIYINPGSDPFDAYQISFGHDISAEDFNVQFDANRTGGALSYTINELSPSVSYHFKARAMNGCQPGDWSNTLLTESVARRQSSNTSFFANFAKQVSNTSQWIASTVNKATSQVVARATGSTTTRSNTTISPGTSETPTPSTTPVDTSNEKDEERVTPQPITTPPANEGQSPQESSTNQGNWFTRTVEGIVNWVGGLW